MKIFYLVILVSIFSISCKKYLERKSDDSLVVPTTLEDLQALLDDEGYMNYNTPAHGEASADDYFVTDARFAANSFEQPIYLWQTFIYQGLDWASAYIPIYNANLCIERLNKVPKIEQNKVEWENVMGSALFFRAYYFSQIAWTFAKAYDNNTETTDLGIVLRLNSNFHELSVRANIKETYDRIILDAREASKYLPEIPIHTLRPSKAAAYGLLARVFLSMRAYDSAFKYSNLCLSIKSTLLDYNVVSGGAATPFSAYTYIGETIFYTHIVRNISLINPNGALVAPLLRDSYNIDDLRRLAFFRPSSGYFSFKGTYSTSRFNLFSGIATDEMYLTRAECYARVGNTTEAMADINTLMEKRWRNTVPYPLYTAVDATDALNQILIERRKELLMRGLRWMDIKRLNKEGANIKPSRIVNGQSYSLPPNDNRYALPFPDDVIKMTGMLQN